MRRALVLVTLVVATVLQFAPSGAATATSTPGVGTPYPVPYVFLPSAISGSVGAPLPGANDWDCEPTSAHPNPVVLVHGTIATARNNWQTYAPLLANNGYCVFAVDYGAPGGSNSDANTVGGLARMQDGAEVLKGFVAKVLAATGASKVDIVGHSQGTIMPQWWVKYLGGAPFVDKYVSLAPVWHGTNVANPAQLFNLLFNRGDESTPLCVACGQFVPGSAFNAAIRKGGVATAGITYTNIVTRFDEIVVPYTSGIEKGMKNLVLQNYCPVNLSEHLQIAADPTAAALVLNALDPKHPRAVPCLRRPR